MSGFWHYVAVKDAQDGEFWLHENFPGEGYTAEPVPMAAESVAALAKLLREAADEIEKFDPIEDVANAPK